MIQMVRMVIGEVQAQTSEVKSYCNKMIQNLESVSNATSSIGLAVGLQGQAFQSIKSYLSTAYPALAKALILYSESVATANENYLQAYTGKFGAKDLDSDKLQQQIEDKNRLLQGLHEQKQSVESFQRNLPASTEIFFRAVCREMIQTLSSSINRNMAAKNKLEKKLEDFLEFNSHSPSYFEEASSLYGTVSSALSSLGVGKDGQISTGSWNGYGFNSFANGWISEINKKWSEREKSRQAEDEITIEKRYLPSGEIIYQVMRNGKYDKEATAELSAEIAKGDMDSLQAFLSGTFYRWAQNNGKAVLDYLFGERQPSLDTQMTSGYSEGEFFGNLLTLLQSGAEYLGGGLWFIGSTGSLALAGPPTGGSSVGAIAPAWGVTGAIFTHATGIGALAIQNIMSGNGREDNSVQNMDEFFETEFGSEIKDKLSKTSKRVDGQSVYKVDKKVGNLKKNDQIYLDGLHKDHLEVFDKNGNFRTVLNLDGSINLDKFIKGHGRILK